MQQSEKPWPIREKDAFAIQWACESFRPYLVGSKFVVETDYESLNWLMEAKKARLIRWTLRLSNFDFEIRYRRGKSNKNADVLSRFPLETNETVSFDDDPWSELRSIDLEENKDRLELHVIVPGDSFLRRLSDAQIEDEGMHYIITALEEGTGEYHQYK